MSAVVWLGWEEGCERGGEGYDPGGVGVDVAVSGAATCGVGVDSVEGE